MLDLLRGGLVVSCQPLPDEPHDPMRDSYAQSLIATSAVAGGAVAIRCNGPADVTAIRAKVRQPVIGLWKDGSFPVRITPTPLHATALLDAGADIVAADATDRVRPAPFADIVAVVHAAGGLVLADVSTEREAYTAADAGADAVATTLSGYTSASPLSDGPDLDLLERVAARSHVPVIAEGRYRTHDDLRRAFAAGAHAVVVGNAITSPLHLTRHLVAATPRGVEEDEGN
ncbi:putative N-acetylmannosamine-6-phosphate 2-epimerase [Streptomyces sp. NPDC005318]|uniref:N-acetylmannosamine-6-phosphate 2-epimerase n=1 Tax=Streptomyces sp. NPDC005318 TaxID=3157031 RepID=UPI0033B86AE6